MQDLFNTTNTEKEKVHMLLNYLHKLKKDFYGNHWIVLNQNPKYL